DDGAFRGVHVDDPLMARAALEDAEPERRSQVIAHRVPELLAIADASGGCGMRQRADGQALALAHRELMPVAECCQPGDHFVRHSAVLDEIYLPLPVH